MADYNLGTAKGSIEIDASGAKRGVRDFNSAVDDLDSKSEKAKGSLLGLSAGLLAVGTAAVGAFGYAIKVAADFESQLSGIKAVSGATEKQMESLRKKALKLGADTAFSAGEAAAAMEELARRGLSVEDILNGAADATIALAAATGVDLVTAATISSNAMNAFGLSAQELPKVADLIAGFDVVGSSVQDFGLALQQAGAVANLAGVSFEDTALAIAAMSKAGINGSDAGTSLKTFLSNLQPVTEKQIKLFNELGLTIEGNATAMNTTGNAFFDAQGKIKPMSEIADTLAKSLEGMSEQQRQAALEALFGSDAIRAAAIIAGEGAAGFDALALSMGSVSAADQAAIRMDNLKGSIEQFKGSIETLLITAGTPFLGFFREIVDAGTGAVNKLGEMDEKTQTLALGAVGATGALAGLLGGIGLFAHAAAPAVAGIGSMIGGIGSLASSMGPLLTNPITLVVVAIAALVAGFIYAYQNIEGFREAVDKAVDAVVEFGKMVWEWIVNNVLPALQELGEFFMKEVLPRIRAFVDGAMKVFGAIADFIVGRVVPWLIGAWDKIVDAAIKAWNWFDENVVSTVAAVVEFVVALLGIIMAFVTEILIPAIISAWNTIAPVVMFVFETIATIIETVADIIVGTVKFLVGAIMLAWNLFGDNILAAVELVWNLILGIIETVLGIIRGIFQVFTAILTGDWDKLLTGLRTLWDTVWNAIKTVVETIINGIVLIIQTAIDAILFIVETAWNFLKLITSTVWNILKATIETVINAIKATVETVFNAIVGVAETAWNLVSTTVMGVVNTLKDLLFGAWESIKGAAKLAWDILSGAAFIAWEAIKSIIMTPINAVKNLLQGVWDGIKSAASTAWEGVKNAIEPIINTIKSIVQGFIDLIQRGIDLFHEMKSLPGNVKDAIVPWDGWLPGFAKGGIVTRQTLAMIGEGNRPEAVIPLTDPARALELMRTSGLDSLVMSTMVASAVPEAAGSTTPVVSPVVPTPSVGSGPAVAIEQANFYDQTDVDLLLRQAEFARQSGSL